MLPPSYPSLLLKVFDTVLNFLISFVSIYVKLQG